LQEALYLSPGNPQIAQNLGRGRRLGDMDITVRDYMRDFGRPLRRLAFGSLTAHTILAVRAASVEAVGIHLQNNIRGKGEMSKRL
jgi:hypothetical protein